MFTSALVASIIVALLSLTGVFLFGKSGTLLGSHRYILPVAVGVFLGVVFFDLIPETIEMNHELGPVAIAVGFLGFYLLSHFLSTFHHHHAAHGECCTGTGAQKLLVGDAIHNIADGVVIATTFLVDPALGIAATIGIALHEIPQEIAEFGVLLEAGYTKTKAALYNLLSASSIIIGVLATALFAEVLEGWTFVLIGIAAGNLLYIATADLIPELRSSHKDHFWQTFLSTVVGLVVIATVVTYSHSFAL